MKPLGLCALNILNLFQKKYLEILSILIFQLIVTTMNIILIGIDIKPPITRRFFYTHLKEVRRMNFGQAIDAIKRGHKAAREGWNGKNQYIELASNISYINADGYTVNAEHEAIGNKAIAFVGTSGVQLGWLASQADMLAEDWKIV